MRSLARKGIASGALVGSSRARWRVSVKHRKPQARQSTTWGHIRASDRHHSDAEGRSFFSSVHSRRRTAKGSDGSSSAATASPPPASACPQPPPPPPAACSAAQNGHPGGGSRLRPPPCCAPALLESGSRGSRRLARRGGPASSELTAACHTGDVSSTSRHAVRAAGAASPNLNALAMRRALGGRKVGASGLKRQA
jgi:hypothetical protein